MAILKRLMNIAFLTLIATFMVMASLVSASAYSKKVDCEADEARSVMYANPKGLEAARAEKPTQDSRGQVDLPPGLIPIACVGSEHGWQRNLYMNLALYSVLMLAALLILLTLNYVVFGHATVWHRGVMERK